MDQPWYIFSQLYAPESVSLHLFDGTPFVIQNEFDKYHNLPNAIENSTTASTVNGVMQITDGSVSIILKKHFNWNSRTVVFSISIEFNIKINSYPASDLALLTLESTIAF